LIEDGHFFYRGHDAVRWAESASLEETARLLWSCGDNDPFEASTERASPWDRDTLKLVSDLPLTERCQILLPLVPLARATAWQRDNRRLWPGAATLLRIIAAAASATQLTSFSIHAHLARTWDLNKIAADIVRRALVLLADHELNASAFAVRVVASTGASLGACLNAGLSAMSGPLHGGTTSLVEALLEEVD
jgi:citrate synthase